MGTYFSIPSGVGLIIDWELIRENTVMPYNNFIISKNQLANKLFISIKNTTTNQTRIFLNFLPILRRLTASACLNGI
jgi:hypothetical protein